MRIGTKISPLLMLAVLIIILVCYSILLVLQRIGIIDYEAMRVLELFVLITLVLVTASYADSAKTQADASLKMAQEMKEQRYSECIPVLLVVITQKTNGLDPNEHLYRILQTGVGATFEWANLGKGVAINARFSLWGLPLDSHPGKVLFFPPSESKALEVGAHVPVVFDYKGEWFDQPNAYCPRLEAEYQDIYERCITTVQEFRINAGNRTASLGELYFKINGRRLGSEKTSLQESI